MKRPGDGEMVMMIADVVQGRRWCDQERDLLVGKVNIENRGFDLVDSGMNLMNEEDEKAPSPEWKGSTTRLRAQKKSTSSAWKPTMNLK